MGKRAAAVVAIAGILSVLFLVLYLSSHTTSNATLKKTETAARNPERDPASEETEKNSRSGITFLEKPPPTYPGVRRGTVQVDPDRYRVVELTARTLPSLKEPIDAMVTGHVVRIDATRTRMVLLADSLIGHNAEGTKEEKPAIYVLGAPAELEIDISLLMHEPPAKPSLSAGDRIIARVALVPVKNHWMVRLLSLEGRISKGSGSGKQKQETSPTPRL